jgi:hypothetical protein
LCASRSSGSDGAVCRPTACARSRWPKAGRERPRCRVARAARGPCLLGSFTPRSVDVDEAREQPPSSGGSSGNSTHRLGLAGCHARGRPDGHHVREDARSARRRARFSAALRPRDTRGSRVSVSRPRWLSLSVSARP